jgi:hypothetical protein
VVCVFAREVTDDLTSLVKKLDDKVAASKAKRMAGFVVFLTNNPDTLEGKLQSVARDQKIAAVPLTLIEGLGGPPAYKVAKDAEVTVMMWVGGEVKVNHVFKKGALDKAAVEKVVADTGKILE